MEYEVLLATVEAHPTAAVTAPVPRADIAARFGPLLDVVWRFVRAAGMTTGHNVFLYRGDDDLAPIEFAVQVDEPFDDGDGVACSETPAGRVATTTHVGPYHELGAAHAAVRAWCARHDLVTSGVYWETYGDWDDDPARLRTDVFYLLD
jgi:effector-binding domain-containing protein